MPVVPELQLILDQLAQAPIDMSATSPDEMRVLYDAMRAMAGEPPVVGSVEDRTVPGPAGDIPVRVYRPDVEGPSPVLVYLHGGGWVIGDLDSHDVPCRALCRDAEAVVVSVDYRLAPEHPHPAAVDDAWAALTWVASHAEEVGGDPTRLAVGGDSAGGNLAAVLALRARDEGGPSLVHQMLVYPVTDVASEHPSWVENGEGYFLTADTMRWFIGHYLGADHEHGDPTDPGISPLRAEDLSGLPPAQVLTAEFDPLRDEGDAYAARLAEAGVPVDHVSHPGLVHGFLGMGLLSPDCASAAAATAERLRAALRA
jgi:acetyl esterase